MGEEVTTTTVSRQIVLENKIQETEDLVTGKEVIRPDPWREAWPVKYIFGQWAFIGGFIRSPKLAYGVGKFIRDLVFYASFAIFHSFDLFDICNRDGFGIRLLWSLLQVTIAGLVGVTVYGFFSYVIKHQEFIDELRGIKHINNL